MHPPLVLIVDDNPENLSVVGELLQPRHAVRVANSGRRALQMAGLRPQPDLILLDVMMPGMDGFEVLQALQAQPDTADIPVILLTALTSADDQARGLQLGAADHLGKPVHPALLLARVAAQLARHAASRRQRAELLQLQAELQRQQADLLAAQDLAPQALLSLLEARHPDAVGHRLRSQAYLRSLAQGLRRHARFAGLLDERQVELLLRAAPLHDIGLLAIPERVLDKPGALDADERALMQTHARIGAQALHQAWQQQGPQSVVWLPWAREIALGHHERWDGQGYPQGLAGEAIPWPVRLVAVVDVYDALTSPRPHRPAMSHVQACALVDAERGGQFDPDVVEAFLDCAGDWPAVAQRHG